MKKQPSLTRRAALVGAAAGLVPLRRARAQSQVIRIGFLSDLSGPYRDNGGVTSIACAPILASAPAATARSFASIDEPQGYVARSRSVVSM